MGYKIVVGGSKTAKRQLQSKKCFTTKAGAQAAVKRLRAKADRFNLYPGSFTIIPCGR